MENLISILHSILFAVLALLYIVLIIRFYKRQGDAIFWDRALAQIARISLLALYISGLWMSMRMGIYVSGVHHVVSILPVVIILVFQYVIPQDSKNFKAYTFMFSALLITCIVIALTARLNVIPKF